MPAHSRTAKATRWWTFGVEKLPVSARNYVIVLTAVAVMLLAANILLLILDTDADRNFGALGIIGLLCVGVAVAPPINLRRGTTHVPMQLWELPVIIGLALAPPYVVAPAVIVAATGSLIHRGRHESDANRPRLLLTFAESSITFTAFCFVGVAAPPWTLIAAAVLASLLSDLFVFGYDVACRNDDAVDRAMSNFGRRLIVPIALSAAATLLVVEAKDTILLVAPAIGLIFWWASMSIADTIDQKAAWKTMESISSAFIGELDEQKAIRIALERSLTLFAATHVQLFLHDPLGHAPHKWSLSAGDGEQISFDPVDADTVAAELAAAESARRRLVPLKHSDRDIGFLVITWTVAANRKHSDRQDLSATLAHAVAASLVTTRHSAQVQTQAVDKARQAQTDALTGLGNRSLLLERGPSLLLEADEIGLPCALILFDLDGFKLVNDTLGHSSGDVLLQEVGRRIKDTVRGSDLAIRLGGDEFAVLAIDLANPRDGVRLAGKIKAALAPVIVVDRLSLTVEASFGISIHGKDGDDIKTLLKMADIAMYRAKSLGRNGIVEYTPGIDSNTTESLVLANDLRQAIYSGTQLLLHYQPQIDLISNEIIGMEALVRWKHPNLGMLNPDKFIPLAEHSGLIQQFTQHVLDLAISGRARMRELLPNATVSVNLSARNLLDRGLAEDILATLQKYDVSPEELVLEVTETSTPGDNDGARRALRSLSAIGCRLSIDDFGSGYATLNSVRDGSSLTEIKIDRDFVGNIVTSPRDATIVETLIRIGHACGCRVVAEGVEDAASLQMLRDFHCDAAQGFYIRRPAPIEDILLWAHAHIVINALPPEDRVGIPGNEPHPTTGHSPTTSAAAPAPVPISPEHRP